MEFQAVVLAGGGGGGMYPLAQGIPKPLLPVANRPLLRYQLDLLEKAGFQEAIVVTTPSFYEEIHRFVVEELKTSMKIDFQRVDGELGSADALRQIAPAIKTDVIVISGDLVTDVFIHYLADIHRSKDASITMLLKNEEESKAPGPEKTKKKSEDDIRLQYIGLSGARVVLYQGKGDVQDELKVSKAVLRRHPQTTVYTTMRDAHLYIFAPWVLRLLQDRPSISNIGAELVPYVVAAQFSKQASEWPAKYGIRQLQSEALSMTHSLEGSSSSLISVWAYLASPATFCSRITSPVVYLNVNRSISTMAVSDATPWGSIDATNHAREVSESNPKAQIGDKCLFGEGVTVSDKGDRSTFKWSIIGKHCKIGAGVRIQHSVLMDYVVVEDKCTISGSVICRNVTVGADSTLVDCQVGPEFKVAKKSNVKGEALCDAGVSAGGIVLE